jgi:hypothetical protein
VLCHRADHTGPGPVGAGAPRPQPRVEGHGIARPSGRPRRSRRRPGPSRPEACT